MTPVVTAVDLARRGVAALRSSTRPGWRDRLVVAGPQSDDDLERFVLEVRRRTPFVPALAARPVRELVFRGVRVPARRRVLLDVFGTDHDERLWPEPFRFDPDRFVGRSPGLFELVPQGGGDPARGHRCPGEGPPRRCCAARSPPWCVTCPTRCPTRTCRSPPSGSSASRAVACAFAACRFALRSRCEVVRTGQDPAGRVDLRPRDSGPDHQEQHQEDQR